LGGAEAALARKSSCDLRAIPIVLEGRKPSGLKPAVPLLCCTGGDGERDFLEVGLLVSLGLRRAPFAASPGALEGLLEGLSSTPRVVGEGERDREDEAGLAAAAYA